MISKKLTSRVRVYSALFLGAITLFVSGCAGDDPQLNKDAKTVENERRYTTAQLQDMYVHLPKHRLDSRSISQSRKDFDGEVKKTFADIKKYKKELNHKSKSSSRTKRYGKDILPVGEATDSPSSRRIHYSYPESSPIKEVAPNTVSNNSKIKYY